MDYLKSVSRGVQEQGQAEGAAELLLGLVFILMYCTDMAPMLGEEDQLSGVVGQKGRDFLGEATPI